MLARRGKRTSLLYRIYRDVFSDTRRERLFLSSVGFFIAFGTIRSITHAIRANVGPFHNVTTAGGLHIHHLVWGILLLLGVGYLWLLQLGTGIERREEWLSRLTAIAFGVAAALTLDEFALWLTLQDVYWEKEGRNSIDAVLLFGGILSIGLWGHPFFRAVAAEVARLTGGRARRLRRRVDP